jgi:hypothetical protein
MVKLLDVEQSVEMKNYDYLRVIPRLNVRRMNFRLDQKDFESTRQIRYYLNRLVNKLKTINRTDKPFVNTFHSRVLSREENSITLKIYELSATFYDRNDKVIYEYCPATTILDNLMYDWEFYKGSPIAKSNVAISNEDSKTMVLADYVRHNTTPNDVIKEENFVTRAYRLIGSNVASINGIKYLSKNFEIANIGLADKKFERSTILTLKLELKEECFDMKKTVLELHKRALSALLYMLDKYKFDMFHDLAYVNTEMGLVSPTLLVHLVKLEENISNSEDMQIDRFISNILNDASSSSLKFTVCKLLIDQEVDMFVSEYSENLKTKRVYELALRSNDEDEKCYVVAKNDNFIYPNPENTFDLIDRDVYIKKVVESSVTGLDDYIEFFAIEEVKFDEEPTEECCECKEFED